MGSRRPAPKLPYPESDPFQFDPSVIPSGKSYQWVAVSVLGEKQNTFQFERGGWKPVPFRRHAKIFSGANVKGKIIVLGQMLVERPVQKTNEALADISAVSRWQDLQRSNGFSGSVGVGGVASSFSASSFHSESIYKNFPDGEPIAVEVKALLLLTGRQVSSADVCGISSAEYGERVMAMVASGDLAGAIVSNRDGTFSFDDRFNMTKGDE